MTNLYWLPIMVAVAFLLARVARGRGLEMSVTPRQATLAVAGLIVVALGGVAAWIALR